MQKLIKEIEGLPCYRDTETVILSEDDLVVRADVIALIRRHKVQSLTHLDDPALVEVVAKEIGDIEPDTDYSGAEIKDHYEDSVIDQIAKAAIAAVKQYLEGVL